MKNNLSFRAILAALIVMVSCGVHKETQDNEPKPIIEITCGLVTSESCDFTFRAMNSDHILILITENASAPTAEELAGSGVKFTGDAYKATGLKGGTLYYAYAAGVSESGRVGKIFSQSFKTLTNEKYPWEKAREGLPEVADIALCYGGSAHRNPVKWDQDRFAPMVTYVDGDGLEKWLFESFLAIEFADTGNNMTYAIGYGGTAGDKDCWQRLIDYWFEDGYGFDALDAAIESAKRRIGEPKSKRYVIMNLPDAIIYQKQTDETSSTTYWGRLNGKTMDFSKADDRRSALCWYIDEVRARFNAKNYKNLDLIGFYIISEDLAVYHEGQRYGWSQQYKRWEEIFPYISRYLDPLNEGVYWIPYFESGGYQLWKSLFEIDLAIMQPNHFWNPTAHSMIQFFSHIKDYGMGMELEFDDAVLGSSEAAKQYKENLRDYFNEAKKRGVWGTKPFAMYAGENSFYKLAMSKDALDQELFLELCDFIADNPIKKY